MEPKIQDTFVKAVEFQITSLTRFYLLSAQVHKCECLPVNIAVCRAVQHKTKIPKSVLQTDYNRYIEIVIQLQNTDYFSKGNKIQNTLNVFQECNLIVFHNTAPDAEKSVCGLPPQARSSIPFHL